MDQHHLTTALSLPPATLIRLLNLTSASWGRQLIVGGLAGDLTFELRFEDVREVRWQVYGHMPADPTPFPPSALVGLRLGRDQHRQPAQLLAEHFGAHVTYGRLVLAWANQLRRMPPD